MNFRKFLYERHVSNEEYEKLSDIKQIKLKMEYDEVISNTEPINFGAISFLKIIFTLLFYLLLISSVLFIYNVDAAVEIISIIPTVINVGIIGGILLVTLSWFSIITYSAARKKQLENLLSNYFTKIKRELKK